MGVKLICIWLGLYSRYLISSRISVIELTYMRFNSHFCRWNWHVLVNTSSCICVIIFGDEHTRRKVESYNKIKNIANYFLKKFIPLSLLESLISLIRHRISRLFFLLDYDTRYKHRKLIFYSRWKLWIQIRLNFLEISNRWWNISRMYIRKYIISLIIIFSCSQFL